MIILCNAGGLGGGGNLTPFIVIFFNLTLIESIPIGNFIGLISSLSRFIINYAQRHPKQPERLAIDYDIIELSMPILYLGTLFGVQIGTRLNEVQLATTFACVLFFVSYKTTTKAISMIREENAKKKMKYLSYTDKNEYKDLLLPKSNRTSKQNSPIKDRESDSALQKVSHQVNQNLSSVQVQLFSDTPFEKQNQQQEKRQMLEKKYQQVLKDQSQHFTLKRSLTFGLTLGFLMITSTLLNYYVNPMYGYASLLLFLIYAVFSTIKKAQYLQETHSVKLQMGYQFDQNDLNYENYKVIFNIILLCHISGILGGVVGIAGGIILAPLFLQLGMLPVIVASTNQYLALISTIAVSSQYWYLGMMNWQYCSVFGFLGIIGSYIGIKVVMKIVQKSGRQSIMVVILAFVLFTSFILVPIRYLFLQ
eukprot:403359664